ncbi:hypothetical protein DLAC_08985 [Tieghemostelium lacteum]|uniref:EGF-like domain-containing protein n=1 Tax=Tieghemostelium lacteum TaxID=361077 RepID=A0A151Z8T9_TIELA|nr:hypothetical protein DLAC_08985 [Tieghemostelium lacteum]|eukprot:KYQ90369.1 hypothetical protein DLAC_08985 [Tieghemostelium lacteum]
MNRHNNISYKPSILIVLFLFLTINLNLFVNGQTLPSFVDSMSIPKITMDNTGACLAIFDLLVTSDYQGVSNYSSGVIYPPKPISSKSLVSIQLNLPIGAILSFNLLDTLSNPYNLEFPQYKCYIVTQLQVTNPYTTIYSYNNKLFKSYQMKPAIRYNSINLGFPVIQSSTNSPLSLDTLAMPYDNVVILNMQYKYPFNVASSNNQVELKSTINFNALTTLFSTDLENSVGQPSFEVGSYNDYPGVKMFSLAVNNMVTKSRVIAYVSEEDGPLQFYPVLGNNQTVIMIGHYLGIEESSPQGPFNVNIVSMGSVAPPLLSITYSLPAKTTKPDPGSAQLTVVNTYSLSFGTITSTIVNQGLSLLTTPFFTQFNPMNSFPYGALSGKYTSINYMINLPLSKFAKSGFLNAKLGTITLVKPNPNYSVDTTAPQLYDFEFIPLEDPTTILVRTRVSDDISGVKVIIAGTTKILDVGDLVDGDSLNGVYEKIFNFMAYRIATQNQAIIVFDNAVNGLSIFPNTMFTWPQVFFDLASINIFYFDKQNSDISVNGTWNALYFSYNNPDITRKFGFKLISTYEIALQFSDDVGTMDTRPYDIASWDESVELFKVDFYIPPRLFSGNLDYIFQVDGEDYDTSTFSTLVGPNATLTVYSSNADEMPPIVNNITTSGDLIILENDIVFFVFNITEDYNDIESINITIASELDPVGYRNEFKFGTNTKQVSVSVNFTILSSVCVPQTFYIKELSTRDSSGHYANSNIHIQSIIPNMYTPAIFNPLYKFSDYLTSQLVRVTCSSPSTDTLGPTIMDFKLSTNELDVSSMNRSVTVTFEVVDLSGISTRHVPIIYLETYQASYVSAQFPAKLVRPISNISLARYSTDISVPYMFGYPFGIGVSVYGLYDLALNLQGLPFGLLQQSNYNAIIKTVNTYNGPIIESSYPFNANGGTFAIYGRKFGIDPTQVIVSIVDNYVTRNYTQSAFEQFSGIYIRFPIPKPVAQYFEVRVIVNSTVSNTYLVGTYTPPTLPPTSTPVNPPKCPGSPSECSGNGNCIVNEQKASCQCTKPWVGDDCSYKIFIVPQPSVDPNEPNSTIDFTPPATNSQEPSEEVIFYTSLVSILSIREIQIDQTVLHDYTFKEWMYKDISTNQSKIYQYLTNITHEVYKSNTLVNVSIEWFDDYTNISFADQIIEMTPSSLKYRIELSPYQFEKSTNTMDIRFLVSLSSNGSDESCSLQKQGDVFENDFVSLELDNHSFYGRFIKRAVVDGRNRLISNTIESLSQENSESSAIVSIHIPNFEDSAILDPDFSILINHDPITSDTDGSFCKSKENSGLSKTKIAGIVIGCVAFAVITSATTAYIIYKKKQQKNLIKKLNLKMNALDK